MLDDIVVRVLLQTIASKGVELDAETACEHFLGRCLAAICASLDRAFRVASSSRPERIELSLRVTGLLPRFAGRLFSATMVDRGKPAPDLFRHAAATMGHPPAATVVVEDSPVGPRAAAAAGMRAVTFTGGSHAGSAAYRSALVALDPAAIIDDMTMLPKLLPQL